MLKSLSCFQSRFHKSLILGFILTSFCVILFCFQDFVDSDDEDYTTEGDGSKAPRKSDKDVSLAMVEKWRKQLQVSHQIVCSSSVSEEFFNFLWAKRKEDKDWSFRFTPGKKTRCQVGTENPIYVQPGGIQTEVLEVEGEERYHYTNLTTQITFTFWEGTSLLGQVLKLLPFHDGPCQQRIMSEDLK